MPKRPEHVDASTQYLLQEYENIAAAHFKTIDTLTAFFKNYLLIMSVPITVAVAILPNASTGIAILNGLGPWVLTLVAAVGLLVFFYVANLRMDAILYARTINALRKYFYDQLDEDLETRLFTRVLPQTQSQPAYHEMHYFWPVAATFALIDGAYLSLAAFMWMGMPAAPTQSDFGWIAGVFTVWALAHFFGYWVLAWYRETYYLRNRCVGIDLDGVVNNHAEHFCHRLAILRNIDLKPGNITTLPVRDCGQGVSRDDEIAVFNDPRYWTDMPAMEGAAESVAKLTTALGYKVIAFTQRGWPDVSRLTPTEKRDVEAAWERELRRLVPGSGVAHWIRCRVSKPAIERLTREWLDTHGFPRNMELVVEGGTESIRHPQARKRNRFHISQKKRVKFFVEDDLEKARKLAYICDVVFLINHPYNEAGDAPLPGNVVRVGSWAELYKRARQLS